MKKSTSWIVTTACLFVITLLWTAPQQAWAAFDVDWGISHSDDERIGYEYIADWLVDNSYYSDLSLAIDFAKTGYIGNDNSDPDPFFWNLSQSVNVEIVQELGSFSTINTLGYYTVDGDNKTLTQLFGGMESGPETIEADKPFGLYMRGPFDHWFTDRTENNQLARVTLNEGGDAQALIYELKPNQEWLVAWEELDASTRISDNDYNDMFVKVSVVPEPISSILFLLGGGAFTYRLRRRKNLAQA